jgi:preprotein translocase subunit YajC
VSVLQAAAVHHPHHGAFLGIILLVILVGVGFYFWGRHRERRRAQQAKRDVDPKWGA